MKHISFLFSLLALLITPAVHAAVDVSQQPELYFETLRTQDAPGFFRLTVVPAADLAPLRMREVYVKNYSAEDEFLYEPILLAIENLGGQYASPEAVDLLLGNPYNRITFLGDKDSKNRDNVLHFKIQDPQTKLEEFEAFHSQNLPAVYAYKVKVDWSDTNISEVYPTQAPKFLTAQGVTFYGKFERSSPTLVKVSGATNQGVVQAQALVPLDDSGFIDSFEAFNLPQTWDALANPPRTLADRPFAWFNNAQTVQLAIAFGLLVFIILVIREFWCLSCPRRCERKAIIASEKPTITFATPKQTQDAAGKPIDTKKKPSTTVSIDNDSQSNAITMDMKVKTKNPDKPTDQWNDGTVPFSVEKKKK